MHKKEHLKRNPERVQSPFLFEQGKTLKQTFTVQPSFENLPETKTTLAEPLRG
jgi:hypothetical protein